MTDCLQVIDECNRAGISLDRVGNYIRVAPKERITDELRETIREHKLGLLEVLADRHEAREERAATLEYEQGLSRKRAETEAKSRINFVECSTCENWTGESPCAARLPTDGDHDCGGIRICIYHTPNTRH